eukprot:GFYU01030035.1.p1 GENE.GFYU01030035.1~~GFYU01030035.1.p1  ORF type:complete len:144 (-),score=19.15 GFYU01030035.1:11-442(-)
MVAQPKHEPESARVTASGGGEDVDDTRRLPLPPTAVQPLHQIERTDSTDSLIDTLETGIRKGVQAQSLSPSPQVAVRTLARQISVLVSRKSLDDIQVEQAQKPAVPERWEPEAKNIKRDQAAMWRKAFFSGQLATTTVGFPFP